jgi:hypothetical protein
MNTIAFLGGTAALAVMNALLTTEFKIDRFQVPNALLCG